MQDICDGSLPSSLSAQSFDTSMSRTVHRQSHYILQSVSHLTIQLKTPNQLLSVSHLTIQLKTPNQLLSVSHLTIQLKTPNQLLSVSHLTIQLKTPNQFLNQNLQTGHSVSHQIKFVNATVTLASGQGHTLSTKT